MKLTHGTTDDTSSLGLYIRGAIPQLAMDCTHQVDPKLGSNRSTTGIVHPEGCTSAHLRCGIPSRLALPPR